MRSRHFAALLMGFAAAVLPQAGCKVERGDTFPKYRDRVELFSEIEKLAIVPVRENGRVAWPKDYGAEQFSVLFAEKIVAHRRFKIVYPQNLLVSVDEANREMTVRCLQENRKPAAGDLIDLGRSDEDAVAAGRAAGADAVMVVTINDFEVYPPKRIALDVRIYMCGAPSRNAMDIISMSEAGVPAEIPAALREKFIWERQKHYDSLRKNAQTGMDWHASKYGGTTGFGDEVFYYSTEKFLDFVAEDLTDILCADADRYRLKRWLGGAGKDPGPSARGVRPDGGGESGFESEQSEHGIRRDR